MDIPINVTVECADGACGKSTWVIINPTTQQVTHIVVREDQSPNARRLVPLEQIESSQSDRIRLRCTRQELSQMLEFIDYEYLPGTLPLPTYAPGQYFLWPYATPANTIPIEHYHVPPGELGVRRGAHVEASDGRVGRVDEFIVDPGSGHITHMVLRQGHLWGSRDVAIPVGAIDHIQDNIVYLKLNKQSIKDLPEVPAAVAGREGAR